jgi:hypothetical protein
VGVVRLGNDLGLPGFDEDDGGDEDDQYRYEEGDNDWLDGRVSYALFGRGVLVVDFCSFMDWLDAEAKVRG